MKQIILSAMALFLAGCTTPATVTESGKPTAEIVIAADAHPAIKYAAEELQRWIREISGAELPIRNAPGNAPLKIMLSVNSDLEQLKGNDGYAVQTSGDTIHIFGSCPKGVLNGAYKWLFRNTDIIWARPDSEFGTVYSRNPDLKFVHNDYIDIPVYRLRGWQMKGQHSDEWQARQGSNWTSGWMAYSPEKLKFAPVFEYGGGHNLIGRYITEKKYYDAHPEYFSMLNGKHPRPSTVRASTQLCFTNPEVVKAFIAELDARIKENPNYETYRIMTEDNWNVCECPECLKSINIDGKIIDNQDKAFRSTQFFLWLNQIARHMQKNYPGKRILTFGYFFTYPTPYCRVEPNISISFCPINKDSKLPMNAPGNQIWDAQFLRWMSIKANLTWREYYGLVGPFPRPMDIVAMADWRYAHSYGVDRTYSEMRVDCDGDKSWDVNALYFWVMANGNWNPDQDVHAMRREFLTRVFGPAADDVGEFYRIVEKGWFAFPSSSQYTDKSEASWRSSVVSAGTEDACRAALERAAAKVIHPNAVKMLQAMRDTFEEQVKLAVGFSISSLKTDKTPVFDPDFQTGAWPDAEIADQFYLSDDGIPLEKTAVRLLYDAQNLYIGVKCFDREPDKIFAKPAGLPRDTWPSGDKFEFFLTGAENEVYQIVFDPNGNLYDARDKDPKWNGDIQLHCRTTADGWSAMIAIPFKSLGFESPAGSKISTMFMRYWNHQARKTEVSYWQKSRPHNAAGFGEIVFKD